MRRMFRRLNILLFSLVILLLASQSLVQMAFAPASVASPSAVSQRPPGTAPSAAPAVAPSANLYKLEPLPYDYAALEPYIDARTMQLHHDKHHGGYVKGLNEALKQYPMVSKRPLADLVRDLNSVPEPIRKKVRNFGGGHINHTLYWSIMAPKAGGAPKGPLAEAINKTFGSFEQFKQQFNKAGADRFGSGWVWLVRDKAGQLKIMSTPNQDNPIMEDPTLYPIMGNDVWEHAYYLKYQSRRAEYMNNWWNVVNWTEVERRYAQAMKG